METKKTSTDEFFEILLKQDEITWQSLIYELIRTERMDPWDIDVSLLAKKYIEVIKKLQEFDVVISGKVVLSAAMLLNIKSNKLLEEEANIDKIINPEILEEQEEIGYSQNNLKDIPADRITLIPRTPQPRKRKVSIFDLVEALHQAIEVKKRRVLREVVIEIPQIDKNVDITKIILDIYKKIKEYLSSKQKLTFKELVGSDRKEDQIATFVPLLHLSNQGKIDLLQEIHFGDIEIKIVEGKEF